MIRHSLERRHQMGNKGFTLIEVLIASIMLAIIAVPLLHSFMTSAKTNATARKIQNATELGTNIMETVKANSLQDLAFQMNYPTYSVADAAAGTSQTIKRLDLSNFIVGQSAAKEMLTKKEAGVISIVGDARLYSKDGAATTASVTAKDGGLSGSYTFNGQSNNIYCYGLSGLTAGKSTYDAEVMLDPSGSQYSGLNGYNTTELASINTLDSNYDAFFVQNSTMDSDAATILATRMNQTAIDSDAILKSPLFTRKITITVTGHDNGWTQVYIEYTYKYSTEPEYVVPQTMIFDNAEMPTNSLRAVYLYFYPMYTSTAAASTDKIVVNNTNNLSFEFYAVKQSQLSSDTTALSVKENSYVPELDFIENQSINWLTTKAYAKLRTNLGENLYSGNSVPNQKSNLKYGQTPETATGNISYIDTVLDTKGIDAKTTKNRIYSVTVKVFAAGAFSNDKFASETPVTTIEGTLID